MAITGDETFTKFRRKLEDVVTVAISNGRKVTADVNRWFGRQGEANCGCPLGCFFPEPDIGELAPLPNSVSGAAGISEEDAWQFIFGFGHGVSSGPYFELGRLYRERFP